MLSMDCFAPVAHTNDAASLTGIDRLLQGDWFGSGNIDEGNAAVSNHVENFHSGAAQDASKENSSSAPLTCIDLILSMDC